MEKHCGKTTPVKNMFKQKFDKTITFKPVSVTKSGNSGDVKRDMFVQALTNGKSVAHKKQKTPETKAKVFVRKKQETALAAPNIQDTRKRVLRSAASSSTSKLG